MLGELGLDVSQPIAVVRTPPDVSLYHRFENPLFKQVLERLREQAQTVVLPRTPEQREEISAAGGFVVPQRAVDAQSLVWHADLVVSAGGTMNREAVALGTPVFTTFEGRLGRGGRAAASPRGGCGSSRVPNELVVEKRARTVQDRVRRDPRDLAQLMLSGLH